MSESNSSDNPSQNDITGRQIYNLTTDVATGANIRWKDNLYQAIFILICLGLGVLIGFLVTINNPRVPGGLIGGFVGVLVGLFGSGIFLMIFRAIKHIHGKHD